MDTAIYYTFSTIAQTLAGGIALLGAFVLFRFQLFTGRMEDASLHLQRAFKNTDRQRVVEIRQARFDGDYDRVLALSKLSNEEEKTEPDKERYATSQFRLERLLYRRRVLARYFRLLLWTTVGLVVVSVAVIATTPRLYLHTRTSIMVIVFGVTWFAACICGFAVVLEKASES
jgi:hypothetical protein